MTLREAYEYGKEQLMQVGIDDAEYDSWYLLEYVTGMNRATYFMHMTDLMDQDQETLFSVLIEKRASRIPLQHLTGEQEFMGFTFTVNGHVLIPRQDTEVLVESVLEVLEPQMRVLDLCTGSGCILISLLKLAGDIQGTGSDLSAEALKVAKVNGERLGVECQWRQGDLFESIEGTYDVIVSNPPYIRTEVIRELEEEVRLHDPMIALDGKEDGLYFYRRIIREAPDYLNKGGRLYFEIGHDQGEDVKQLMEDAGFLQVGVKKDLAGLDRVVFGVYS